MRWSRRSVGLLLLLAVAGGAVYVYRGRSGVDGAREEGTVMANANASTGPQTVTRPDGSTITLPLSEEQWQAILTPEQFQVCRRHATERAFTGEYHDAKQPGTYRCVACGLALFRSEHKFDSGTGWPSYFQPIAQEAVGEKTDRSWFATRTEVHCARCGSHLGHVFDDGPPPTGLRYCINSVTLHLEPEEKK